MTGGGSHTPDLGDFARATPRERLDRVLEACAQLGFAHAGVCAAGKSSYEDTLRAWIADGRHGSMAYLQERVEAMIDPDGVLEGAASIICVADRYHHGRDSVPESGPARGRIARYARGRDYHDVLRRRLARLSDAINDACPDGASRAVVDTAPLLEREHAARAGLGLVGKNTLLIHPGEGSWMLLGEVLTTLEIEPSEALVDPDPCGSCTRCIDACPTDAITPFSVDASRCLAYTTIEHRGRVDPSFFEATGDWLFGCDICQEVCPHNQPTRRAGRLPVLDAHAPRRDGFDLLEVLGWTEQDRRDAFVTSSLKRAKLAMFKRNALICAGNILRRREDSALRGRIEEIAVEQTEDPLVRDTALDVLDSLPAP